MVEVTVKGVTMSGAAWVVLLDSSSSEKTLPIVIGTAEAQAILFELNGIEFPRPLTHDLFRSVLTELDVQLTRIEITELRDETFFAKLILETPSGKIETDARPSDALALALRCHCPIYASESVLQKAGIVISEDAGTSAESRDRSKPGEMDPVDALKEQLSAAVEEERYEDAARIRDKLRFLSARREHGESAEGSGDETESES